MKNVIDRTLFWFSDGDDKLIHLNKKFYSLSTLLNRLISHRYEGQKIKFINLFFRTEETYILYPQAEKYFAHFFDKQLAYDDVFDLKLFNELSEIEQKKFIWERAFEAIKDASTKLKNKELLLANDYAFKKGLEIGLNPDYRMVHKHIILFNQNLMAAVWISFKKDGMYSVFTLEKDDKVIFEKEIDKTDNGVEYFLEIYKDIELINNDFVIRGKKDIEYLPLKIPLKDIPL